jgi:hypothetical protein
MFIIIECFEVLRARMREDVLCVLCVLSVCGAAMRLSPVNHFRRRGALIYSRTHTTTTNMDTTRSASPIGASRQNARRAWKLSPLPLHKTQTTQLSIARNLIALTVLLRQQMVSVCFELCT